MKQLARCSDSDLGIVCLADVKIPPPPPYPSWCTTAAAGTGRRT